MKLKLSLPQSPMWLYYFAKFCGLAPVIPKGNTFHSATLMGNIYPITIAVLHLVMIPVEVFLKMTSSLDNLGTSLTLKLHIVAIRNLTCYLTTASPLLTLVLMRKKIANLLNKLFIVSNELGDLSIVEDHEKLFRNLFVSCVGLNVFILTVSAITRCIDTYPLNYSCFVVFLNNIIIANTIFIFAEVMLCIKRYFVYINRKLGNLGYRIPRRRPCELQRLRLLLSINRAFDDESVSSDKLTNLECIRKTRKLHSELCYLVDQTTHIFGAPIFLIVFEFLIKILFSVYWIYCELLSDKSSAEESLASTRAIAYCCIVMASSIIQLFMITYACATISQQRNYAKRVLINTWNIANTVELQDEIFMFNLQLAFNLITVSALGFFDLDYSCIYKIFCTVVAYLMIMVQLDTARQSSSVK